MSTDIYQIENSSLERLISKFPKLLDSKNRLNANLFNKKHKDYDIIQKNLKEEFILLGIEEDYPYKMGFSIIKDDCKEIKKCLICGKTSMYMKQKFTSFCSMQCSHSKEGTKIRMDNGKITNLLLYGCENVQHNKEIRQRTEETLISLYGGIGLGSSIIKTNVEKTNLERFGCKNPFGNIEVIQKIKDTHFSNYGGHFSQYIIANNGVLEQLNNIDFLQSVIDNDLSYSIQAKNLGITLTTLLTYIKKSNLPLVFKKYNRAENSDINSKIYIIEMTNEDERFLKVGITTREVKNRFNKTLPYKVKIWYYKRMKLQDAFHLEQKILDDLKEHQYMPLISFSGKTECINIDQLEVILSYL